MSAEHTPGQMAEREAEVRTDYARVRDGHGGCQEDVGALLEILEAERAVKADLLEALQRLADFGESPGDPEDPLHRVAMVARAAIAKATGGES